MGDSVPDGAGGVTLREMLSHMLKPFFSLSSSLTSSAAYRVSPSFTSGGGSLARS